MNSASTDNDEVSEGAVTEMRDRIRAEILSGKLAPGVILSQVQLAQRMGVSRTPMREALRMLQEEGLVEIEPNRRARVVGFDAEDLELLYSSRILLTAMATTLTVPLMSEEMIEKMEQVLSGMDAAGAADDLETWRRLDREFHRAHCALAPVSVKREIDILFNRSTLYRLLRVRDLPHLQGATQKDHHDIFDACRARNGEQAVVSIVRHHARIALTLLAHTAPEHDPKAIRATLKLVGGDNFRI